MRLFVYRSESVLKSTSSYSIIADTSYIQCISIGTYVQPANQLVKITISFERYKIAK